MAKAPPARHPEPGKAPASAPPAAEPARQTPPKTPTPEARATQPPPAPAPSPDQARKPEPSRTQPPQARTEAPKPPEKPWERPPAAKPEPSKATTAEAPSPQPTKAPEPKSAEPKPAEPKAEALKPSAPTQEAPTSKSGLFSRLRKGLSKTSSTLTEGMAGLVMGKKAIDDELLEELETRLLMADVGIEATEEILDNLTTRVARKELKDAEALVKALEAAMVDVLEPVQAPLKIDRDHKPYVILVLGINGSGKTTTIGKLTHRLRSQGLSVMLAAGDTFRAAAVEQLQTWGERNQAPVISQGKGADSASVIYDGLQAAKSRGMDVLIADTAGRLHTQTNLMDELKKVKRVIQRLEPDAPHEILLVVDGGTGQNALNQAQDFDLAMGVTGIAVTKLDGTAKGGILFAMAQKVGIPVRFIGVGESIEDLREFDAKDFARALLSDGAQKE
ncbi:signal recognition particle-docking protein FtsY [Ectothiorhodospira variabilis]|uniref:signal recognition particle-docking protein FtsY n=1 Tax=Ectothiorhodospira variabilis TaxID=505694 RepID=UPI001EFAD0F8|nr:signal recognition particle-docking protein FtsY [Ectothiorhodospira variabilis]